MAKPNPNPKTDPPTTKLTTSVSAFSGVAQQVTVSFPSISVTTEVKT